MSRHCPRGAQLEATIGARIIAAAESDSVAPFARGMSLGVVDFIVGAVIDLSRRCLIDQVVSEKGEKYHVDGPGKIGGSATAKARPSDCHGTAATPDCWPMPPPL